MNMYWNKADYVKVINNVLEAREDHKELKYHKNADGEYLILSDIIGHIFMFDVTGYSESDMFFTIAQVCAGYRPKNLILDRRKQMSIARSM